MVSLRKGQMVQRINENHDKHSEAEDRRMKCQEGAKPADNRKQEGKLVDMVYDDPPGKKTATHTTVGWDLVWVMSQIKKKTPRGQY